MTHWQNTLWPAYGTYPGHRRTSESVFCARPTLAGINIRAYAFGQCNICYDPDKFNKGVELLLSQAEALKDKKTYQYDAVDMVRQSLASHGRIFYYNTVEAFNKKDIGKFTYWSEKLEKELKGGGSEKINFHKWESAWVKNRDIHFEPTNEDPVTVAIRLFNKYQQEKYAKVYNNSPQKDHLKSLITSIKFD